MQDVWMAKRTVDTLTVADIRHLFETSSDAAVVRDCVRAIGVGPGGVFENEIQQYQREKATERLVVVHNDAGNKRVVMKHRDFTICSVTFAQPYVCCQAEWINVMPGACWFMTIAEAKRGIDCLIEAGGLPRAPYQKDDGVGPRFWKLMQAARAKDAAR
jgi:hypothetical protein